VPRLNCTFREFIEILEAHGFVLHRHEGGSHRIYRGEYGGEVRLVVAAYHNINDEIPSGTLQSMIRTSGLPKKLFRK